MQQDHHQTKQVFHRRFSSGLTVVLETQLGQIVCRVALGSYSCSSFVFGGSSRLGVSRRFSVRNENWKTSGKYVFLSRNTIRALLRIVRVATFAPLVHQTHGAVQRKRRPLRRTRECRCDFFYFFWSTRFRRAALKWTEHFVYSRDDAETNFCNLELLSSFFTYP